jgi:ATP-dependent Clp protease ATP-binding subunit ClpC
VGTEHLLLGLIKLGEGVAINVLQKMGLDLERVRMEVEKHVGSHPETNMIGNVPYTPRFLPDKAIDIMDEAGARALLCRYAGYR